MILVHSFSALLYMVIVGSLWFTMVWLFGCVFMLHYTQYFMECGLVSLLQFEGSHTLGNTYSAALVCCLDISSFKILIIVHTFI